MKDWKTWALLICLFLLVKMCGGCDGCDGSESSSGFDIESVENAIEIRLISRYNIDYPHVTTIEQTNDNPPTYEFEYDYVDRFTGAHLHKSGRCTFYEDGQIKDLN